ncbi:MAG: hypothetical protein WKF37_20375 [Bryobacteraceae bacterium]
MFFAAPPPPPPVSFGRDIAPVMAMHCNGCHGTAGSLSTRSHRELMLGGNLGKAIVPGDSGRSLLLHFVEGRRGERHRMPKDGRPLSHSQVDTIRRWIDEGAKDDDLPSGAFRITRPNVAVEMSKITRVACRINTQAYVTITARDPVRQTVLWSEVASVKSPREGVDSAEPGETIFWDLRAAPDWPKTVTLELVVEYAENDPSDTEFSAKTINEQPDLK